MVILAVNTTLVPAQIGPAGAATIFAVGTTLGVTTIIILFEATLVGDAQGALDVRMQVTTSPLFNVEEE